MLASAPGASATNTHRSRLQHQEHRGGEEIHALGHGEGQHGRPDRSHEGRERERGTEHGPYPTGRPARSTWAAPPRSRPDSRA